MNKKYLIVLFILLASISIGIFLFNPKEDSLDNFAFKDFNFSNTYTIEIKATNFPDTYICLEDNNEASALLNQLKNVKLKRYSGNPYTKEKRDYNIYIIDTNTSEELIIYVFGDKYIQIDNKNNKNPKNYKIVDGSLDINYLNELFSKHAAEDYKK